MEFWVKFNDSMEIFFEIMKRNKIFKKKGEKFLKNSRKIPKFRKKISKRLKKFLGNFTLFGETL